MDAPGLQVGRLHK